MNENDTRKERYLVKITGDRFYVRQPNGYDLCECCCEPDAQQIVEALNEREQWKDLAESVLLNAVPFVEEQPEVARLLTEISHCMMNLSTRQQK